VEVAGGGGCAPRPFRKLAVVLELMLQHVPASDPLRPRLEDLLDKARYMAPECQGGLWRMAAVVLYSALGDPPLTGWAERVRRIWMGLPAEPEELS